MRRRPPKTGTPLNQKQEELAQRELQLRGEMEKLERMIAEAPRVAEETTRRQREELFARASEGRSRLDVSIALQDKRWADDSRGSGGRRVSLRKERREGRIVFLVLVIALCVAIIWLMTHLHF
jgi:septal ring factor EnvC (AmiA/AmiB activator)